MLIDDAACPSDHMHPPSARRAIPGACRSHHWQRLPAAAAAAAAPCAAGAPSGGGARSLQRRGCGCSLPVGRAARTTPARTPNPRTPRARPTPSLPCTILQFQGSELRGRGALAVPASAAYVQGWSGQDMGAWQAVHEQWLHRNKLPALTCTLWDADRLCNQEAHEAQRKAQDEALKLGLSPLPGGSGGEGKSLALRPPSRLE